jgi:MFS family permease
MPVVVLFYQDNGLSMTQIFSLKSIYSIGIVIMEIPSGYLADVWGRKKTLLGGSILSSLGFLTYCFSHSFGGFACAEFILGIGFSFVSGADSAMLYDTLKDAQKEQDYIKHEGRITSAGNFAEAFAGILGGLIAAVSLRMPFYFQFLVSSVAIPASFLLKEPERLPGKTELQLKDILATVKNSFFNAQLRSALLISSLTGTATLTYAWFVQPFLKEAGIPVSLFGILWTLLNISVGIFSMFSYRIERLIGLRSNVLLICFSISAGFVLTGLSINQAGIVVLFAVYIVRGIATPVFKDYINQFTASEVRATIMSVRNFVIRIIFAVIGPILGICTDLYGLKVALIIAGLLYLVPALFSIQPLLRRRH